MTVDSYYRATHQTTLLSLGSNQESSGGKLTSPTVNQPARETVIIEDDSSFMPSGSGADTSLGVLGNKTGGGGSDATYASQLSLLEGAGGAALGGGSRVQ
ncbi:hypothetical protein LSTR_LSTR015173 [Laodelphax striatellus]|uniref:Uncharacterized protein n=1 Tax=Laodelphax striatellus TaxID=195883 RepID=A0A482XPS9_LAOST|nr:hypothetical protein LSTR_LSTR015173 [Laodelphax striatellus]